MALNTFTIQQPDAVTREVPINIVSDVSYPPMQMVFGDPTLDQAIFVDAANPLPVTGNFTFSTPQHVVVDSGSLTVSFSAPQHVIVDSGTSTVNQGTNPWITSLDATSLAALELIGVKGDDGSTIASPTNRFPVETTLAQSIDSGNTTSRTSANGATQFVGTFTHTRSIGIVRELTVLAALDSSGNPGNSTLGGTFVFEYSEDGINATISESRTIDDFDTVRDFDLINAGEYYRVKFTPSRALTGSEAVFITTTLRKQNDGQFVRLANQQIEENNAAMGQTFAYIKGFSSVTGESVNIRPSPNEALRTFVDNFYSTPNGSIFTEGVRDIVSHIFSVSQGASAISRLQSGITGTGTATLDTTEGQVVFASGATANSHARYFSEKAFTYESGHGLIAGQSIRFESLPTGNAFAEWGCSDIARQNGTGHGVDATGFYVWRMKNSVYESKVYQANWNRDKANGQVPSLFKFNGIQQAINALKNNVYYKEYEWFGSDTHNAYVKPPQAGQPILTHAEEYPNQNTGSSLPDPNLFLFVDVFNGTSGANLKVRSGSWHGGSYTNNAVAVGLNPNNDFISVRASGRSSGNSTTTPLNGNTGGTDHIFRGTWFEWQNGYVSAIFDVHADVAGTLFIDYSEDAAPVDGSEVSVDDSLTFPYDPSATPLLPKTIPVQSRWVRARYVNGPAAQSDFELDTSFLVIANGLMLEALSDNPIGKSLGALTKSLVIAEDSNGTTYDQVRTTAATATGKKGLNVNITQIEDDILFRPLPSWQVRQFTIGTAPVQLDSTKLASRRSLQVKNHDSINNVYINSGSDVSSSNGEVIPPLSSSSMMLSTSGNVWAIASPATINTLDRDGGAASGTATSPSNARLNDGVYATMAGSQTIIIDTFTAGTSNSLQQVSILIEAHKNASPATETVAFVDIVSGTAGNVGSVVTDSSVTANAAHFYVVKISRKNTSAAVTTVVGMGLTWTLMDDVTNGTDTRISNYYSTGTGATSGLVTANFSTTATNAVIGVSRYSNVKFSAPITAHTTNTGTTSAISGSLSATNLGMLVLSTSDRERTSTPGSGFTEQLDRNSQIGGGGASTASLAVDTFPVTATASTAYSATLSGAANWSAIIFSLEPDNTAAPVINITYKLSGVLGATSGSVSVPLTTDSTLTPVDITGDRSWVIADIPNVQIIATGNAIGTATALVDHFWLQLVDTTGSTVRVSLKEIA